MDEEKGITSFVSMVTGLVALLAKTHPAWAIVKLCAENVPQFSDVLTWVASTAVVVAGSTHPAAFIRRGLAKLGIGRGPSLVPPAVKP